MKIRNFIKEERVILIICFLVFVVSAAYAFCYRIQPAVDARAYDTVAMNIIKGQGFRLYPEKPLLQDDVITYQGPAYQYFLAIIYFIFGHHYEAVWLIQALLRALSALLIFLICKKIFKAEEYRRIGHIAAIIFGFYPDLIEISAMLLTETFYIFFTILVVYIFFRYYEQIAFKGVFWLGLTTGISILIRSTAGGIFAPVFIFYFWRRKAWKHLIFFLILIAIIMTPWTIRNYRVYHAFIPTMANFGYNLWTGNHEGGDGEGGNVPQHFEVMERYGVIGANSYGIEQFKNFILNHPLTYIKLTITRIVKYFSFIRPMGFWFYQRGLSQFIFIACSAFASVILFTLGFAGIFAVLKKERKNAKLLYLITFASLTFLSVVPIIIETRYRLPIYPFMAVFSGFFVAKFLASKKEYSQYLIAAFSVLLLFSIIDFTLELPKVINKLMIIFHK